MPETAPRSNFATVNEVRLHYLEWGDPDAPDLLLVHGWGEWAARPWTHIAELLDGRYHLVAPDLRGHGESERPEAGYRLRDFTEDLSALIAELGLSSPLYAGNSWGGCIGTVMAADYAQDISRAFLGDPVYWKMVNAFATFLPAVLRRRGIPREELAAEMRLQRMDPEAIERELLYVERFREDVMTRLITDNRGFALECEEFLGRIGVPTLIVVSDYDAGGYILKEEADHFERIASPMVRLSRWAGVGHSVVYDQPERFVSEMTDFFAE